MLMLLKKFLKESGVPCFMHQVGLSIDSVYRFNLYSGQAVFLFELGDQPVQEFSTQFDFDFTQNVVIFDTNGGPVNDLLSLLFVPIGCLSAVPNLGTEDQEIIQWF